MEKEKSVERRLKKYNNPLIVQRYCVQFAVKIFRTLFLIGLCYLFLFPIFYMVVTAFQDPALVNDPTSIWIPKKLSLDAIKAATEYMQYGRSIIITLEMTVFSTLATLCSCSLAGYALARFKFAGKGIVMAVVFLLIVIPPQTLLSANYVNFRYFDFGGLLKLLAPVTGKENYYLLDSPLTFVLPALFCAGLKSGLFIFIFKQFFGGLPKEMEEAACIDGCGVFMTYFRVMVPLAVPAFVTVMLFSFIWHWNDYYTSSMYFTSGVAPLSVMLSKFQTMVNNGQIGENITMFQSRMYLQAAALLVCFPPLILYAFTQKYFTESISRTGIVG